MRSRSPNSGASISPGIAHCTAVPALRPPLPQFRSHLQPQFARRPLGAQACGSASFCPARPPSARDRTASVPAKSSAAPNCSAAWRTSRRCSAGAAPPAGSLRWPGPRPPRAAAPRRTPRQHQLRRQPGQLRLPPCLLVVRQNRHLRQVLAQPRIPALEQRQQLMPDAVARVTSGIRFESPRASPGPARRYASISARVAPSSGRTMRPSGNTTCG
jgi:hypothetical protein